MTIRDGKEGTTTSRPSISLARLVVEAVGSALRAGRFWFGLGLSGGAAYLALRTIDPVLLRQALVRIDWTWAALALLSVPVTVLAKAARWRALYPFQAASRPSLWAATPALLVGMMVNLLIPARLGELARVYALEQLTGQSKALSLGTIVVEKWVDLLMLLALLAGLLLLVPWPAWLLGWGRGLLWLAILLTLLITGARALPHRLRPLIQRWSERLPARWRALVLRGWETVEQGTLGFYNISRMGMIVGWSLVIWLLAASTNLFLLRALALPAAPVIAFTLLVILQAGSALPSSPAKIGVFHFLTLVGLELFDIPREAALAFAVWLHLIVVGLLIALGIVSLLWISHRAQRGIAAHPAPGR